MIENIIKLTNFISKRSVAITITLILFTLYFSPYFIKGKDTYITIHDNLDSINEFGIFNKTFQGSFFESKDTKNFIMPGLDKSFLVHELCFDRLLFKAFGYFYGFVINEILYRIIGFLGFLYLIKTINKTKNFPNIFHYLLAFSFISLPFYPRFNLSLAGIPLLILCFLNLNRDRYKKTSFIIILLYPFYSSLFVFGVFAIFLLTLTGIFLKWKKILRKEYIIGVAIYTFSSILANYSVFLFTFFYNIPISRIEFDSIALGAANNFKETLLMIKKLLVSSQHHARSNHVFVILPSSVILFIFLYWKKHIKNLKLIFFIFIYILIAAVIASMYRFEPVIYLYQKLGFGFNFGRFSQISSAAWYTLWALLLLIFYNNFNKKHIAFILILPLLSLQIFINAKSYSWKAVRHKPTFKQFMSEKQFSAIKKKINLSIKDRVGCIGFFPSVANYNGIKTVGAYKNLFSLNFKNKFYKIIKEELEQNQHLKRRYLYWGSRVYLYDDRIGVNYSDQNYIKAKIPEITCDLDINELKKMNVNYLFSTAKISNHIEKKLTFLLKSKKPTYYYRLYVYRINSDQGVVY